MPRHGALAVDSVGKTSVMSVKICPRSWARHLLFASTAILLPVGNAWATPECQNLGAGDPMTGGDDECAVTAASPLANIVDADAGTDTIHYDTSGGSFSTGAAAIGNLFLNFELAHVSGGNTLTLSFSPASPIDWTIDAGTTVAIVQGNGQLGSGAVNLNGTLDVGNNLPAVVGPLFGTGTVSLATGASLTLTGASWSPIFAGVIQGDGSITVNAASGDVQILSGANTYTGGTNIIGGALGVYSDANLGAASGGISQMVPPWACCRMGPTVLHAIRSSAQEAARFARSRQIWTMRAIFQAAAT